MEAVALHKQLSSGLDAAECGGRQRCCASVSGGFHGGPVYRRAAAQEVQRRTRHVPLDCRQYRDVSD